MGFLTRALFAIPSSEVRVDRRGFQVGAPETRSRLESIGEAFVAGYHAALEESRPAPLARRLDGLDRERVGFSYEGAAMALALVDAMIPWRRSRWRAFLDGPGEPHAYMVHVGAGWALARLGAPVRRLIPDMDPLLRWLAFDGFGFHEGYFHWSRYAGGGPAPSSLTGYERRAFDQGLGRSLWFVDGADPGRVARDVADFDHERHADLWSGVGLASTYAGGADPTALASLRAHAGTHAAWLAQGAAFAAKARWRAGNATAHTRAACETLCAIDDRAAAEITDVALLDRDGNGASEYESWRRRVRDRLVAVASRAPSPAPNEWKAACPTP